MSLSAATRRRDATARPWQPRPRADEIERGAVGARELARRRRNSPARMRAIASESSASSAGVSARSRTSPRPTSSGRSRNWYTTSTSSAPSRRHASAYTSRWTRYSDSTTSRGLGAVEDVALVVEDERLPLLAPEDVEPAVQEDAVVLERERPLRARALEPAMRSRERPTRSTRRRARRSGRAPRRSRSGTTSAPASSSCAAVGAGGRRAGISSSSRWTASPISFPARPPPTRLRRSARGATGRSPSTRSAK